MTAAGSHRLSIDALEIDRRAVAAAAECVAAGHENGSLLDWREILTALHDQGQYEHDRFTINIHWGDARHRVRQLAAASQTFDLVFLDAFSTQRNSELWTLDFFQALRLIMSGRARLLTYCTAAAVRSGLIQAGFAVGATPPYQKQRGGTIAVVSPADLEWPLPDAEVRELLNSSRGLPYRDPNGLWSNREILRRREERVRTFKTAKSVEEAEPDYHCQRCGACCSWSGYVRVTPEEIKAIAAFLEMPEEEFRELCTRPTHDRPGVSLTENPDGKCIFLTPDNCCEINPVKPEQCKGFPSRWQISGFDQTCRAATRRTSNS